MVSRVGSGRPLAISNQSGQQRPELLDLIDEFMLELDSPRWLTLKSSVGGNGEFASRLIQKIRNEDGDEDALAELQHEACHQFTVGEVAYAVAPHVIDIARTMPIKKRIWPLSIVGDIVAARTVSPKASPKIPSDLHDDYVRCLELAIDLTTEALRHRDWQTDELHQLIGTLAALHGHGNLAMHLLLSGPELSCPSCGEYIAFGETG